MSDKLRERAGMPIPEGVILSCVPFGHEEELGSSALNGEVTTKTVPDQTTTPPVEFNINDLTFGKCMHDGMLL